MSSGSIEGVACKPDELSVIVGEVKGASFAQNKLTFVRAVCQNFVFTTAQVAEILKEISMSNDKLAALELFRGNVSNPSDATVVADTFSMSGDKTKAIGLVTSFPATKPCVLADYPIEKDGHRSADDMARFLAAIESVSMSSDRLAVVKQECEMHPTPPFNCEQLVSVMQLFNFANDAAEVLDLFAGPAIVYPMTCEQILSVLEIFSMSNDKLAVLPSLKKFIKDPQNKLKIVASFSFSNDKDKAEEILRDCVVRVHPPTPPAEQIQAALRKVGMCPAGFAWRQVNGGWRCAAGGHFVSDAALKAAMG